MIKTIRSYDMETVSGVARFIIGYAEISEMSRDHRIDTNVAIADMHAAIRKANLSIGEKFVISKASATGEYLYGEEKRLLFSACSKISKVFRDEEYGKLEINRYMH